MKLFRQKDTYYIFDSGVEKKYGYSTVVKGTRKVFISDKLNPLYRLAMIKGGEIIDLVSMRVALTVDKG